MSSQTEQFQIGLLPRFELKSHIFKSFWFSYHFRFNSLPKGWTLAAMADELGVTVNAVEKWKAGDRNPSNFKSVLNLLGQLNKRRRIPKKKRYIK